MSLQRQELGSFLNELLSPRNFTDYGPNGLQVEGSAEVKKVAFAVSATKYSINKAIADKADTLIVHHGLFWKFHGARTLTGSFGKRVLPLVRNNLNLFGYHLPLDAHMEVGNAAQLAYKLGLIDLESFGDYKGSPTGVKGRFAKPVAAKELKQKLATILNHTVIHACEDENENISTMGIITGGANSEWKEAAAAGLDSYLTGEMSEHDWHESAEAGLHMFAGGHNATEQFGIQALMEKVRGQFPELNTFFIPSDNPA